MKINQRLLGILSLIFLGVSIAYNVSQYFQNRNLKKENQTELDRIKAEKQDIIITNEQIVDSLLNNMAFKDIIIAHSGYIIDSLTNARGAGKVILQSRIKEIKTFNALELTNYWKDELDN